MTRFVSVMTCQLNIDLQMEHTMLENQGSCFTFELGLGGKRDSLLQLDYQVS